MHIDHNAVAQALASFPRHQLQFTALSASNGPARVFDLSVQKDFMNLILDQFCAREKTAQQSVSEVAFVVMQIMAFLPAEAETLIHQQETLAARIMQWLEEHYSEKFQLDDLANAMGLSRSYTSRIFRQQTGAACMNICLPDGSKELRSAARHCVKRVGDSPEGRFRGDDLLHHLF